MWQEMAVFKRKEENFWDYHVYHYRPGTFLIQYLKFFCIVGFILYLFYRNGLILLLSLVLSFYLTLNQRKKLCEERKWRLNLQFKDAMTAVAAALEAGYSVENAFGEAVGDLKNMYEKQSDIMREFVLITKKLRVNIPIEDILWDFANRSGVEDIENFAEIFCAARRSGGNFIKVIRHTSKNISDKIEVKREILTMMTGKRLEAKIMSLIPAGIIMYLWLFSPGYLDSLYGNLKGVVYMSVMLILYMAAYFLSVRIMEIQV